MATFAAVLKSDSSMLKYRTVKCPDAMEAAIAPFIAKGWSLYSDITKEKYSGFSLTLGVSNTYSVRRVTISQDGTVKYLGRTNQTTYISKNTSTLLKRMVAQGIDIKKAKVILAELSKY